MKVLGKPRTIFLGFIMKYLPVLIVCMGISLGCIGIYNLLFNPIKEEPLYCINNKIYEKYQDKFYKPHYNAKTGLAEMCVTIDKE